MKEQNLECSYRQFHTELKTQISISKKDKNPPEREFEQSMDPNEELNYRTERLKSMNHHLSIEVIETKSSFQ